MKPLSSLIAFATLHLDLCLHSSCLTLTSNVRICPHQLLYMISGIIGHQHLVLVNDVIIRSQWGCWGWPRNDKGPLVKHQNDVVNPQIGNANKITVFLEEVSLLRLGGHIMYCSKSLGFCGWEEEDGQKLGSWKENTICGEMKDRT